MRVIVESPFAGGFNNVKYSRACIRDALNRGESPFASHLLYTQAGILDDKIPEQRRRGIDAAIGWLEVADYVAVYVDKGVTTGMVYGIARAARLGKPIHIRWIETAKEDQVIEWSETALLTGVP